MKFYVYILRSLRDGSYYVGYSADLERRIWEHNEGSTRYSSTKRPWELVYHEGFDDKSQAMRRELQIKSQKSRKYIERLIANGNV